MEVDTDIGKPLYQLPDNTDKLCIEVTLEAGDCMIRRGTSRGIGTGPEISCLTDVSILGYESAQDAPSSMPMSLI